ncbi:MAG: hypothetical protein LDL15_06440 [Yonghaparkia sp.]|nr:hypothetical protein [Microcella sp.]
MSGSSGGFRLREPDAGDVERLARIHVQCWEQTYGTQLPPEFFGERAVEFRRRLWNRMVNDPAPGSRTVVAERGGEVVGFALDGLEKPDERVPSFRESRMVRPDLTR